MTPDPKLWRPPLVGGTLILGAAAARVIVDARIPARAELAQP